MRGVLDEIRASGAELVLVGNGSADFARNFKEDLEIECPVLVDEDLVAYRAAGLRRGRAGLVSPRLPRNALRALGSGFRQTGVQGDPWQLGGVFVIGKGGDLLYRHASREAGDHAPVEDVLSSLGGEVEPISDAAETSPALAFLGSTLSRVVDPLIAPSFDRTGFQIHRLAFDPNDLDVSLAGQRCLISGANSGIGYEAAKGLADLGAEVLMLCRDEARGNAAADEIRKVTGNPRVSVSVVDLSDLASVRAAATDLGARPVDVLVHNAGTLPHERHITSEGLETTFATHVIGPFLLTSLLRRALAEARDARVVWVSSGGMYTRRLNLEDVDWSERAYDGVIAYAETKRAQVVLAELWSEVLASDGISVSSMHPGWADTPAVSSSLPTFYRIMKSRLRKPAEGADTIVWLAAHADAMDRTGGFFFDRARRRTHLLPSTRERPGDRERLWALCERLSRQASSAPSE